MYIVIKSKSESHISLLLLKLGTLPDSVQFVDRRKFWHLLPARYLALEPQVSKRFLCTPSFLRICSQKIFQQINSFWAQTILAFRHNLWQSVGGVLLTDKVNVILECLDVGPCFLSWRSHCSEDEIKLFQLSLTFKKWLSEHKFGHDAANRPDIQLQRVAILTQQQLGWSIPHSNNFLGHPALHGLAGESKVTYLQDSFIRVKQIRCFEISMKYLAIMQVCHSFKEILHHAAQLWLCELDRFQEFLDLMVQVLHHDVYFILGLRPSYPCYLDYVEMIQAAKDRDLAERSDREV